MKIEKLKESEESIKFLIKDIDFGFANVIRRSVFEIPVLAIDEVEFYKNDSALYDEILAHRLGLVPLKASNTFTKPKECSCKGKGCLKCTAALKLKAKGPATVSTSELKAKGIMPVFKDMPLVLLEKDQELEFSATATLGTAKEHAKFSCGMIWFNSFPEITIKGCDGCSKCVEICPKKAITLKDKTIIIDPLKCDLCDACKELCKDKKAIKIQPSKTDFIFNIESFGQIDAREIFIEAVKVWDENLKELESEIK